MKHQRGNDIRRIALRKAGGPSKLELAGLLIDDGKRPDGVTYIPWTGGSVLEWDFTCVSRQAQRNINDGFHDGPSVANLTEEKKRSLYSGLPRSCQFVPISVENVRGISESSYRTLSVIGRRIV